MSALPSSAPPAAERPLAVGLLVDGPVPSEYVRDLATWAASRPEIAIRCAIQSELPKVSHARDVLRRKGAYDLLGRATRRAITTLEERLLRIPPPRGEGDIADLVPERLLIHPKISASGLVHTHSEEDLEKIRALGLDVLLRCGGGILRGGILEACPFGVLSFHHGDNRVNRGGPAGFWEVYHRWDETGFIIQRLTDELDGGEVLFRGAIATRPYFAENWAALERQSAIYMKDFLLRLSRTRELPAPEQDGIYSGPLYTSPSFHQVVSYAARAAGRMPRQVARRVAGYRSYWSVALVRQRFPQLALWRHRELEAPAGHCWADPFLWRKDGRTYCLVEDYRPGEKGHIAALEIARKETRYLGKALVEPFHLSFPFLFEHEGRILMCPETQEAREIRVYEATEFPLKWEHRATLMRDVSAVDTMLFPHGGRWWMLTTLDRAGTGDTTVELNLFSADHPLSSDWKPHPESPVLVSPNGGRNAGMTVRDGKIYRFGQRQGFGRYGVGILIHEITELTETRYRERLVSRADPHFGGIHGIHHLSTLGDLSAVDLVRYRRTPALGPRGERTPAD